MNTGDTIRVGSHVRVSDPESPLCGYVGIVRRLLQVWDYDAAEDRITAVVDLDVNTGAVASTQEYGIWLHNLEPISLLEHLALET